MTEKKLGKLELAAVGVGVLPIPIVSEVALCYGFYKALDRSAVGGGNLKAAGIPAALLTKYAICTQSPFYQSIYLSFFEGMRNLTQI